ncbi:EF-hand domain-containing protein [Fontimonas sp. SYSU GA230001]|uniref:EF-hand domain-containing protein n=1 Tax=Fontimonas sp. SYSU GA230001 TaxID=3142450 RepID=UPI0032B34CF3
MQLLDVDHALTTGRVGWRSMGRAGQAHRDPDDGFGGRRAHPMKRLIAIILPVLAALPAPPVHAASDAAVEQRRERLRQKREQQFRDADRDQSRSLSRAEIEAAGLPTSLLRHFDEIDTDGDGALSPEELQAMQDRRVRAARAGDGDTGSKPAAE